MSKFEKDDLYWIDLMIEFTARAIEYYEEIQRSSYPRLVMDGLDDALASQIAHIGEQLDSKKLSRDLRSRYPNVPWKEIRDYRNLHDYWYQDIRIPQVYEIADSLLEDLLYELNKIREDLLADRN